MHELKDTAESLAKAKAEAKKLTSAAKKLPKAQTFITVKPENPAPKKKARVSLVSEPPTAETPHQEMKMLIKSMMDFKEDFKSVTGEAATLIANVQNSSDPTWKWANNDFQLSPLKKDLATAQKLMSEVLIGSQLMSMDPKTFKTNVPSYEVQVIDLKPIEISVDTRPSI